MQGLWPGRTLLALRQWIAAAVHCQLHTFASCPDARLFARPPMSHLTRCSADRPESMRIQPITTISHDSQANAAEGARTAMLPGISD